MLTLNIMLPDPCPECQGVKMGCGQGLTIWREIWGIEAKHGGEISQLAQAGNKDCGKVQLFLAALQTSLAGSAFIVIQKKTDRLMLHWTATYRRNNELVWLRSGERWTGLSRVQIASHTFVQGIGQCTREVSIAGIYRVRVGWYAHMYVTTLRCINNCWNGHGVER